MSIGNKNALYVIEKKYHNKEDLSRILNEHTEVQFVSFVGLDIIGNDTDEKIPVKLFLDDIDNMLEKGVQTDGSSVNLPLIAEINNGNVSMIPDLEYNWYVDYNLENFDEFIDEIKNVGTLRIPSHLVHDGSLVGSRAILKNALSNFKAELLKLLKEHPYIVKDVKGLEDVNDIEEIVLTSATELEFWVKTPEEVFNKEELSASQNLKEQYWKRVYGPVRTALEESINYLNNYGLEMEMGHKEVGGVKSHLTNTGAQDHVMEQLEIDWKYSNPMQAADNEKLVRYVVRDIFSTFCLNTTFMAKPINGVAGSGEHTHLGVCAKLKNGELINLFSPKNFDMEYLTPIGFGALMGLLKNYEVVNPFISSTTDAFNRLKVGYEAPICIVTSLGHSKKEPSRNRTVLVGLIREKDSPLATRFELRSPNPKSNTYLVISTCYMAMLDGIKYALTNELKASDLEKALSKKYGEKDKYLEKDREYRTELDCFKDFSASDREKLFGRAPQTVWENLKGLDDKEKLKSITINEKEIESYRVSVMNQWATELGKRFVPNCVEKVKAMKKIHDDTANKYDLKNWNEVDNLRKYILKDDIDSKSLLTRVLDALDEENYDLASSLQIELNQKMEELNQKYSTYVKNIF